MESQVAKALRKVVVGLVAILVLSVVFGSFGTIGAGERGILLRFSAVTGKVFNEGLYWKLPFVEDVVVMDTRIQKEQTDAQSASKDLQTVSATVALNFSVDPLKVDAIYQKIGAEFKSRLIDPAIQESVKAATAQFTADELVTQREKVRDGIKTLLKEKLEQYGIVVADVNIVDFNFSDSFNRAIEEKVTAEQEALAAKNKLERIKFEADQKVAEAKGKAEAMNLEANALRSNPQVLQLRALEKWDGKLPQVSGGAVPFVSLEQFSAKAQ